MQQQQPTLHADYDTFWFTCNINNEDEVLSLPHRGNCAVIESCVLKAAELCLISSFILHNKIALKEKIIGKEGQEERGSCYFQC